MRLTVTILSLTIVSISLVVCLACGWLLWQKRQETGDRSRTILAVISLAGGLAFAYRIMTYIADPARAGCQDARLCRRLPFAGHGMAQFREVHGLSAHRIC